MHREKLEELKAMKKPDLPKSEMAKSEKCEKCGEMGHVMKKCWMGKSLKSMKKSEDNDEMVHDSSSALAQKAQYLHDLMHEMGAHKDAPTWMVEKMGEVKTHLNDIMGYIKGKKEPKK